MPNVREFSTMGKSSPKIHITPQFEENATRPEASPWSQNPDFHIIILPPPCKNSPVNPKRAYPWTGLKQKGHILFFPNAAKSFEFEIILIFRLLGIKNQCFISLAPRLHTGEASPKVPFFSPDRAIGEKPFPIDGPERKREAPEVQSF
jgi:hypothetical protein